MPDADSKKSNEKKPAANERATVADTPDSDPRGDGRGSGEE